MAASAPEPTCLPRHLRGAVEAAFADTPVVCLPEQVVIDEVQRAPELSLAIKRSVDANRKPGRFLLTGSANLMQLPRLSDSLAGRMECVYLQPFSSHS